ncbi:hypothetical protein Rhopal_004332-T1 [Rhodotorula paludigena]|uniref:NAD(P)-binding domain-containing protein n=1 Tax=Rhodotorula paludigena TaxID=86838 RepID=A0AAV5GRJ5_9BASI|nr:hypothetical protein Rhopal_004332-T1 [Rhodotorula paludigena]
MSKSLFLLGTGFIGGSVLTALLEKKQYRISALSRDPKKSERLEALGVRPVQGELSSDEVISKEAAEADIIMHIATADDLPSVKSILKGLRQRSADKAPAIYIHTSGTGVLTVPTHPVDVIFNDKDQAKFDRLIPDHAPHREIDLTIKKAVESKELNAKVSIMLPPNIYGVGTGPFNRTTIQIPLWIKEAIANLVTAYLTLLSHLEQTTSTPPLYVIAETGEHRWGDLAPLVEKELKQRGLIKSDAETVVDPEGSVETETGTQSRSKAEWLHDWGWQVKQLPSVAESLPTEIDEMQRTGAV